MMTVAAEMTRRGMTLPLLIGGATTSGKHTAVKIAPAYTGPTVHVPDASLAVGVLGKLMSSERDTYLDEMRAKQHSQREAFAASIKRPLLPLAEARARAMRLSFDHLPMPPFLGAKNLDLDLRELGAWI